MKVAGDRERKQISTNKTCYEIKNISTSLLSVEVMGEVGEGKRGVQFLQKNCEI